MRESTKKTEAWYGGGSDRQGLQAPREAWPVYAEGAFAATFSDREAAIQPTGRSGGVASAALMPIFREAEGRSFRKSPWKA